MSTWRSGRGRFSQPRGSWRVGGQCSHRDQQINGQSLRTIFVIRLSSKQTITIFKISPNARFQIIKSNCPSGVVNTKCADPSAPWMQGFFFLIPERKRDFGGEKGMWRICDNSYIHCFTI